MPRKLVLGSMACFADFGHPNDRHKNFFKRGRPLFKSFIESLILYDQVVIPTNDYMPLGILLNTFGERAILDLLETESIMFACFDGIISYVGNGTGLFNTLMTVHRKASPGGALPEYDAGIRSGQIIPYSSAGQSSAAVVWAVEGISFVKEKRAIQDLALRSTVEFSMHDLKQAVAGEISTNLALAKFRGRNLDRLPGIANETVRTLSSTFDPDDRDDVATLLKVALSCVEARAAAASGADDIRSSEHVSALYEQAMRHRVSEGYVTLREITGLVDAGELALQEKDFLSRLIRLRTTRSAAEFRSWFHANCRNADTTEICREYIGLLDVVPWLQSPMARTLRFLAQVGVNIALLKEGSLTSLTGGAAVGALDSFFIDGFSKGSSPKVFVDKLKAEAARSS